MTEAKTFTLSRIFNGPRNDLFDYWTKPELMAKWWGPKEATVGDYTMDFRPGGTYLYSMNAGGGTMWGKFEFQSIKAPEQVTFLNSFSNAKGGLTRHPMVATWPMKLLSVFSFEEAPGGKTKVTINWTPYEASDEEIATFNASFDGITQGWSGSLDRLEEVLASQPDAKRSA